MLCFTKSIVPTISFPISYTHIPFQFQAYSSPHTWHITCAHKHKNSAQQFSKMNGNFNINLIQKYSKRQNCFGSPSPHYRPLSRRLPFRLASFHDIDTVWPKLRAQTKCHNKHHSIIHTYDNNNNKNKL